jgi:5-methylcytosine-specific restriction endonuclease McrA
MKRKGITPTLRFQVLNRDGFTCQYCGIKVSEWIQLQVDHKISVKNWLKNNYSIKKFSYFFNEINNG